MNNETVRKRLHSYCSKCGTPYRRIAKDVGLDNKLYLVSRFARGLKLNDDTLEKINQYLIERGY